MAAFYRCNLFGDCDDNTDEVGCTTTTSTVTSSTVTTVPYTGPSTTTQPEYTKLCPIDRFKSWNGMVYMCGNGECVGLDYYCNGFEDCKDGTDEVGCTSSSSSTSSSRAYQPCGTTRRTNHTVAPGVPTIR